MLGFRGVGIHVVAIAAIGSGQLQYAVLAGAQGSVEKPTWCKQLPRPEYAKLKRVPISDTWFEVYKVAPNVFAIYEPHQSEETIGYLIVGNARALLFDTGMGIGNLKALTLKLSKLPIVVLNSHTHDDHVGNNWQFNTVYGMDSDFTRPQREGFEGRCAGGDRARRDLRFVDRRV
jgi:hypothetical protein